MIDLTLCRVAMTPGEATHTVARGDQPAQHPGDLVAPTSHVKNVSGITDGYGSGKYSHRRVAE